LTGDPVCRFELSAPRPIAPRRGLSSWVGRSSPLTRQPENRALASTRPHPGLLLSLVELADGPARALPALSGPPADEPGDALWLSTSAVDLSAVWGEADAAAARSPGAAGGTAPGGLCLRDYWPIALVGRGSHGEVWKAVSVAPDLQFVALKVLRFNQAH